MQHEYWNKKTRGNAPSKGRIQAYVGKDSKKEQRLKDLMERAEKHYRHTSGTFGAQFVRLVMDEMEGGNENRVHKAIEHAGENGLDIREALKKVKQVEARQALQKLLPESKWVDDIRDDEIELIHGVVQNFQRRRIGLHHVHTYVSEHPMTTTDGPQRSPAAALRELSRKMNSKEEKTLEDVLEKIKNGMRHADAWKEIAGKTPR